jgi:hypothetical protein
MSFLEELQKLREQTPRLFNIVVACENSDYCTHADKDKNCYRVAAVNFSEDCMYGGLIVNCKDCVDCTDSDQCELCYECLNLEGCYSCHYCQDVKNCNDCILCYDCVSCSNCYGCAGLRQKKYHIFNKSYSKEEYLEKIATISIEEGEKGMEEEKLKIPHLYSHQLKNENCVGDYIYNSKNCFACLTVHNSEDCMYMKDVWNTKDSVDIMFSDGSELMYESFSCGLGSYNCNFCDYIRTCSDCEYHILNKPYSKEEYEKKVAEIRKEMRETGEYGKHLVSTYPIEDTEAAES